MISGQAVCGFRDSAYLYYPLFKWIDSVWASGEIPLWNPYCNYGLSVVGDGSSSVFYPGKLIFLCRFLSFPSRYGIYLSVHVLIAAAGAYRFARVMKANQAGATLAAVSYAFGGSVLFQVTNVIYLVSAAWLPFALALVWRGILGSDWRSTVWAGVVCSVMILGGDPQMVYHVGLIATVSVLFHFWARRRWLLKNNRSSYRESYRWLTIAGARLVLMIIVTSCLAAIQILPTAHWAERSERAATGKISNVFQAWNYAQTIAEPRSEDSRLVIYLHRIVSQSLFAPPVSGTLKDATYQFSQPPWSIAELVFPNVMGKPFPIHQRWSDGLPAAERIWTPSIYAGVLSVVLALSQFSLWGKRKRHVWLCRIGLFFALASFGWFGLVWTLNEGLTVAGLSGLAVGGMKIGPQVGGLYWFMTTLLPKYFMFRYPAKLFVVASLMISVLAGLGLTRTTNTSSTRKRVDLSTAMNPLACASSLYCGLIVGVFCVAGLIALQIAPVESWLRRVRPNLFFGPLDVEETVAGLSLSVTQPLIVLAIVVGLLWLSRIRLRTTIAPTNPNLMPIVIVLLTTCEVAFANHWMLAQVDSSVFEAPTEIGKRLKQLKANHPDKIPRIYRPFNVQAREQAWPYKSSPSRLREIVTWQRETLFPKHHLEHGVALLGSFGSVWPARYRFLTDNLNQEFVEKGYLLSPMPFRHRLAGQMIEDRATDSLELKHETLLVKAVEVLPERNRFTDSFGALNGPWTIASQMDGKTRIESIVCSDREIIADIQTEQDLQLRICVLNDDGWKATTTETRTEPHSPEESNQELPIECLNGSFTTTLTITPSPDQIGMRVDLPPGHHAVTFTYSPREFWIGCWISGVSWLVLATTVLVRWRIRRRSR